MKRIQKSNDIKEYTHINEYGSDDKNVAIKLVNVSKTYNLFKTTADLMINIFFRKNHKQIKAVDNVSLEVYKGEVFGILGYNGCGKSTLLKIIAGITTPDKGSVVELRGTLGAMIALSAGFNNDMTGRENIYHRAELLDISREEIEEKMEDIIKFSSLRGRVDDLIQTYSSGMKARLGFAFYVCMNPDIMIVDEITSVGDIKFKRKAKRTIRKMFQSGKTILFVSHNLGELREYCSRVAIMKAGSIIAIGEPNEIIDKYERESEDET